MENRINIAELLKDCPAGMELDCLMYDNLYFKCIREHAIYPIVCYTIDSKGEKEEITFNWYGKYALIDTAKCVIFPKGKTTWEGFVPPCKFKDGDVVATDSGAWLGITTGGESGEWMLTYCVIKSDGTFEAYTDVKKTWSFSRFATKEERQKLFDEIKAHGYTWNSETKTLEILIEPKFKVGDKVRHKNNHSIIFTITSIEEDSYICGVATAFWFEDQDNYELVPNKFDIHTLTPLQPVLVRNTNGQVWTMDFFSHIIDTNKGLKPSIVCVGHCPNQCIPYKGNEFLRGTADECKDFYKTWE